MPECYGQVPITGHWCRGVVTLGDTGALGLGHHEIVLHRTW